ncbi:MAG: glycosyl hydrolase [Verrucomicrobiota bacterium]
MMKKTAVLFLGLLIGLSGCRKPAVVTRNVITGPAALGVPETGAYTGAYMGFGDYEDDVTLERIEEFEQLVGKHQAIVASSSYWGEQSFPTANLNIIQRHGSIPLVFWSPWDRPYQEDNGPDRFSLTSIIAGDWDKYIDKWGDSAREYGHPILVSFGNEMNGTWFPWSGAFYGGKNPDPGQEVTAGTTFTAVPMLSATSMAPTMITTGTGLVKAPAYKGPFQGPETYKRAYRHVVDRVRARGAKNVAWVFHAINYSIPQDNWNLIAQYYPGAAYVDWLGFSVYGEQYIDDKWVSFLPLLEWPYKEICALDPTKPVMLAEWGVGEFPTKGSKPAFIKEAFEAMRTKFPRLKAAVFWNERWQNEDTTYSNLRANSSPEALEAYRQGVADPFWLSEPQLVPLRGGK